MNPTNTAYYRELTAEGATPAVIDEVDENLTYVGYCLPTCKGYADPKWLIRRIQKKGTVQTVFNANGSRRHNQAWTDRATLEYKPNEQWTEKED